MALIDNAQIWWDDDNGPLDVGWWGRYWVDGVEHQIDSIEGTKDEPIESLAAQVVRALNHLDETVKVKVGEGGHRGRIVVRAGSVVGWNT